MSCNTPRTAEQVVDILEPALRDQIIGQNPMGRDARLEIVAGIIHNLEGGYNAKGVNDWFDRPRTQLNNRTPAEIMDGGNWGEDSPGVAAVVQLSESLCGGTPATQAKHQGKAHCPKCTP